MNGLIPPCCFGKIKYLDYSEDPYPLSMKDVNLSYLLTLQLFCLVLFFSGRDFCSKGTFVQFVLSMVWYTWYRLACYVVWKCKTTCSLVWDRATQRQPFVRQAWIKYFVSLFSFQTGSSVCRKTLQSSLVLQGYSGYNMGHYPSRQFCSVSSLERDGTLECGLVQKHLKTRKYF